MLKFKFKKGVRGSHSMPIGRGKRATYYAKDDPILNSAQDLVALFPDKFELVEVGKVKDEEVTVNVTTSSDIPKDEKPADKTETPVDESDVEKTTETDDTPVDETKDAEKADSESDKTDDETTDPEPNELGDDKTDDFPGVKEQDYQVFYKFGKGYSVVNVDAPEVVLNDAKLKKDEVEAFVQSLLE